MKLFQIEEPDGSPVDPDAPGAAVGIDLSGAQAEVALAVGGNAVLLQDREDFPLDLTIPPATASIKFWKELFEGVRLRAERALAQPVTHAVVAVAGEPDVAFRGALQEAAEAAGLTVLRIVGCEALTGPEEPALAAAVLAEDLAPRPAAS